ncbi:aminopeptidase P family protein [Methylocella sp.]|uniref:aminopeptidase P family protein n=1 Tax=Methylocella sp. TaxID=1978226 RepID=UPI0037845250
MFESVFQSFDEQADGTQGAARVTALREKLARLKLDGFLAPRADRHQNEYAPPSEERLAWLTGFSGSAGTAVVLADKAAIFVDGRYALAVRGQVDVSVFEPVDVGTTSVADWLRANLPRGARVGYDPWLATPAQVERLARAAADAGAELVALDANPVDALWTDRPPEPLGRIVLYPRKLAGESAGAKLARVGEALKGADALLVSDPHSLAWIFNIRGADVSHTPLPLGFALIPRAGAPSLYLDPRKLAAAPRKALAALAKLKAPDALERDLSILAGEGRKIVFDAATAPSRLVALAREAGGVVEVGADPSALMRAKKNSAELSGARAAQLRDGAALTRFLFWFAQAASKGGLTEIEAAQALETFRRETGALKDLSFPSISAAGPNAASPHYRVTTKTNARIGRGLYLIDSGGQYEDGTTDVTRTLAVGRPSAEMRDRYTRVLQGHVAIARAVFPRGVSGAQIDALGRLPLWRAGLDFDHGVGHGVGAYLSVHEGPQRISKLGTTPLEPGMILSDEPGYYKGGHWGIRIENLVVVELREIRGAEREMLGFETITLAPYDRALIETKLLDDEEKAWIDAYHARVRKALSPFLSRAEKRWLAEATAPL